VLVDGPIGHNQGSEISIRRAVVAADAAAAQPAITEFEVIARARRATWLRCRPRTGRTHQIRVHMESLGVPLIGDKIYGRSDAEYLAWLAHVKAGGDAAWHGRLGAARQMLHASRLAFPDPHTGARREFRLAPPPDFIDCARREGLDVAPEQGRAR